MLGLKKILVLDIALSLCSYISLTEEMMKICQSFLVVLIKLCFCPKKYIKYVFIFEALNYFSKAYEHCEGRRLWCLLVLF